MVKPKVAARRGHRRQQHDAEACGAAVATDRTQYTERRGRRERAPSAVWRKLPDQQHPLGIPGLGISFGPKGAIHWAVGERGEEAILPESCGDLDQGSDRGRGKGSDKERSRGSDRERGREALTGSVEALTESVAEALTEGLGSAGVNRAGCCLIDGYAVSWAVFRPDREPTELWD
jgi:hypothetical protein